MANFVAFQSVKIDDSFLGEFVKASPAPAGNLSTTRTEPVQTTAQARQMIESYFSVPDSSQDHG